MSQTSNPSNELSVASLQLRDRLSEDASVAIETAAEVRNATLSVLLQVALKPTAQDKAYDAALTSLLFAVATFATGGVFAAVALGVLTVGTAALALIDMGVLPKDPDEDISTAVSATNPVAFSLGTLGWLAYPRTGFKTGVQIGSLANLIVVGPKAISSVNNGELAEFASSLNDAAEAVRSVNELIAASTRSRYDERELNYTMFPPSEEPDTRPAPKITPPHSKAQPPNPVNSGVSPPPVQNPTYYQMPNCPPGTTGMPQPIPGGQKPAYTVPTVCSPPTPMNTPPPPPAPPPVNTTPPLMGTPYPYNYRPPTPYFDDPSQSPNEIIINTR